MIVGFKTVALKSGHQVRGVGFYTRNLMAGLAKIGVKVVEFGEEASLGEVDLVHYPYFDLSVASLPLRKRFPTVVTIHDVTPLIFPQHYPFGWRAKINLSRQKLALKNVRAVITDSQSSKSDISQFLGVAADKIFPIFLAAGDHYGVIKDRSHLAAIKKKYDLPERFGLYIGDINWNKNILGMAEAARLSGLELVLVGKSFVEEHDLSHPELASFKQFVAKFGQDPTVHRLGFVPDEEIAAVVNLAEVVLLPSFYEGFGLTILEAQKCGVPVITSRISSMPEVAGEAAIYVDPDNVESIADGITQLSGDIGLRQKLIAKGLENSAKYSWEETAKQTLQVYHYALTNN